MNQIAKTMATELAEIDHLASEAALISADSAGSISKAIAMAGAMQSLRERISGPILKELMKLRGSRLGFLVDRDNQRGDKQRAEYPETVIRDALIEGLVKGARAVGNEINIISGNCYLTREYYTRKLAEHPGLTNLEIVYGTPVVDGPNGRYLVSAVATWMLNGVPGSLRKEVRDLSDKTRIDERISVKRDDYTTIDQVLGKADRKFKAAIFARITGSIFAAVDTDDGGASPRIEAPRDIESVTAAISQKPAEPALPAPAAKETAEPVEASEATPAKDGSQPQPPTGPSEFEVNLTEALSACDTVADVNAVERKFLAFAAAEEDHSLLARMCDAARKTRRRK